jgi:site-specific recombinase XerD
MEETGRMRSAVARRLSTLASFYKYLARERVHRPEPGDERPPSHPDMGGESAVLRREDDEL